MKNGRRGRRVGFGRLIVDAEHPTANIQGEGRMRNEE
jgi:hypothetical protein